MQRFILTPLEWQIFSAAKIYGSNNGNERKKIGILAGCMMGKFAYKLFRIARRQYIALVGGLVVYYIVAERN